MATEIAILPLVDGKSPDDANSTTGQALKDCLTTLTEQKGFQRAYWGFEVENPTNLRLFVDWDSVDAHKDFEKQDHYKPFLERIGMIIKLKEAQIYHAHFTPHPPSTALSEHISPASEILTIYFPSDYSDADQKKFEEDIKKLVSVVENESGTNTGSAGGWVEELLPIPGTSEQGKVYQAIIGWQSVQAHLNFRETQPFKDNIHLLRGAKDLKHLAVVHYSGTQINSGAGGVGDPSEDNTPAVQGEVLNPQRGTQAPPKTRADGTTTKNNDDLKGAANAQHKERQGRGPSGGA